MQPLDASPHGTFKCVCIVRIDGDDVQGIRRARRHWTCTRSRPMCACPGALAAASTARRTRPSRTRATLRRHAAAGRATATTRWLRFSSITHAHCKELSFCSCRDAVLEQMPGTQSVRQAMAHGTRAYSLFVTMSEEIVGADWSGWTPEWYGSWSPGLCLSCRRTVPHLHLDVGT